jgi:hypothetical protein
MLLVSFSGLDGLGFLQSGPEFRACRDVVHASFLDAGVMATRGRGVKKKGGLAWNAFKIAGF